MTHFLCLKLFNLQECITGYNCYWMNLWSLLLFSYLTVVHIRSCKFSLWWFMVLVLPHQLYIWKIYSNIKSVWSACTRPLKSTMHILIQGLPQLNPCNAINIYLHTIPPISEGWDYKFGNNFDGFVLYSHYI